MIIKKFLVVMWGMLYKWICYHSCDSFSKSYIIQISVSIFVIYSSRYDICKSEVSEDSVFPVVKL